MSKMTDMAMTIEELRCAAAAITETAAWLEKQFSGKTENSPRPSVAEEKPQLSLIQVRSVLTEKSRAGHTAEIRTLLHKYGANKLSELDPVHYEALLQDAEGLSHAT